MIVRFHKHFEKQYKKLRQQEKDKFQKRLKIFLQDEFDPILDNHPLKGKYFGFRSIDVKGDLRALYKKDGEVVIFTIIDNHSNLYG